MDSVITRVFDLLEHSRQRFPKKELFSGKSEGKWYSYSTQEFIDTVDTLSCGLLANGVNPGDKVAVMSANRPEWNIADFAITQLGAIQVPMYPTLSENDIRFILQDAEVKIVFAGNLTVYSRLMSVINSSGYNVEVYCFDTIEGARHWSEMLQDGEQNKQDIAGYRSKIVADDILTIIYTSGTTGTPKGVMLTHDNLISNVKDSSVLYPEGFYKALSFLPLSHIFERMVIYIYLYLGISVYYAESMETIVTDINEVRPHGFTTVPRLLEKVYDRIVAKGTELTGVKRSLFFWALNLGLKYELYGANGWWYEVQLSIANKLVFEKWRQALGGEIMALVSGGAALQSRLARVFWAAKMPVLEGYGLTETSPVITVNGLQRGQIRFTTVGKPINRVEVKIAEDGEVLCKGPNIMKGYYKRPDLTAEVIDADGWFHTGDIGEMVDGFLRITDRKKEIFKTAGGKYIAPQILENKYKESPLIEQIIVIGENRKFPCALIVPAFEALKDWCAKKEIEWLDAATMIRDPRVLDKYNRELERYNEEFGQWEKVKRFELLPVEWSIDGGELTPKLSLKRKVIFEKNKDLVENLYRNAEHIQP
jgi:long-chain acyl-CoA synthetase